MSEMTGRPVFSFTSARMSRPSSSPGPRKDVIADRLALSNDDLKTIFAPVFSETARIFRAMASECLRDSITQGPAKKSGGAPPPVAKPRAISIREEAIAGESMRKPGSLAPPATPSGPVRSHSRLLGRGRVRFRLDRRAVRLGGPDEIAEKRVTRERLRLQLRVELAAEEPRVVVVDLDDLDELLVGRHPGERETVLFELGEVLLVDLVTVPVAVPDEGFAVRAGREGAGSELGRVLAEPHRPAERVDADQVAQLVDH